MKSLGSLILPDALHWKDRFAWSPIRQTVSYTLGGNFVSWSQATTSSGRPITLFAGEESAFLDRATVTTLAEMAQSPNAIHTLTWDNETFSVLFRHHEPPALTLNPLWPGHDLHHGEIRLIQVA